MSNNCPFSHISTPGSRQQHGLRGLAGAADAERRGLPRRHARVACELNGTSSAAFSTSFTNADGQRKWPSRKADLFILRSDGTSCSRQAQDGSGGLSWDTTSTMQELLMWRDAPRVVLVLKKLDDELNADFDEVLKYLGSELGLTVLVEPHEQQRLAATHGWPWLETFEEEDRQTLHQVVDFTVCLGGDGVVLHACNLFRSHVPPLIGFNLGSLGFLCSHEYGTYREALAGVVHGRAALASCDGDLPGQRGVHVTMRMRLLCDVYRKGASEPLCSHEVLNEVVVDRGPSSFLSKLEVLASGTVLTRVQADGVMLATPTGSTAYSVAAGGSMVHPGLPAILFTPICPHSLAFRPVVLPDYADLQLRVAEDARATAWVCFDGKSRQELRQGDYVRVRMSSHPVPTINRTESTTDWVMGLQRCFNWSERVEQKALSSAALRTVSAAVDGVANGAAASVTANGAAHDAADGAIANGAVTGSTNGVANGAVTGSTTGSTTAVTGGTNGATNGAVNGRASGGFNGKVNDTGMNCLHLEAGKVIGGSSANGRHLEAAVAAGAKAA